MLQIHKASAGSGKTYTLAKQYLIMLLGKKNADGEYCLRTSREYGFLKPKAHGQILAVTFTNKATEEMTSRIIKELARLADPDVTGDGPSPYLADLKAIFRVDENAIATSADRALKDLLFNFSWFNVSTIDSFFQNVLHTFTRELELPENFNLELDQRFSIAVAVGKMMSSINMDMPVSGDQKLRRTFLREWLRGYMEALMDQGRAVNLLSRASGLNNDLISVINKLLGENYKLNSEVISEYLSVPSRIVAFEQGLRTAIPAMEAEVVAAVRKFSQYVDFAQLPAAIRKNYLENWIEGNFDYDPFASNRKTLGSFIENRDKRYNKAMVKLGLDTDATDAVYLEALESAARYFRTRGFYRFLQHHIYILGLFGTANTFLEEYCRDNDSFLLGDTNDLLRRIINESETPFIYERIGTQINHFLIDEFQDTSRMQWDNLRPLVFESLSRDNDNLIIGDEKQCIYRFRNSVPELLGHCVEDSVAKRFGDGRVEVHGIDISENNNWRSSRAIVMFNNTLFLRLAHIIDNVSQTDLAVSTYANLVQRVPEKNAVFTGYVRLLFGPPDGGSGVENDDSGENSIDDGLDNGDSGRWSDAIVLQRLGEQIVRQLDAGYRPGDIAVLVRSHYYGQLVINYLLGMMDNPEWRFGRIPIMSSDALEISSSPTVQLIVSVLRLTTTPEYIVDTNSIAQGGAIRRIANPEYKRHRLIHRFELCLFDEVQEADGETGELLFNSDGSPKMRRLTHDEALSKALRATADPAPGCPPDPVQVEIDRNAAQIKEMDCLSLIAITERIINRYIPDEAKEQDNAFLTAFQDLVLDFMERGDNDIDAFLDWWDRTGCRQTLSAPDGMDALTVVTIHQSKGLEYPCVHIPFCSHQIVKYEGYDWYPVSPDNFPGIDPAVVPPFVPLENDRALAKYPAFSDAIDLFAQRQRVDALNVAYVAFTRAVRELCVYADPNPGLHKEGIGAYLYDAVTGCTHEFIESLNLPDDIGRWLMALSPFVNELPTGETEVTIGSPTVRIDDNARLADDADCMTTAEMNVDNKLNRYYVVERGEMAVPADLDELGTFDISNERHRGNFLHNVLSRVRVASDLDLAMDRVAYRYHLPVSVKLENLKVLREALADPRVRPWFEGFSRVITERPLTTPSSVRRPDRVVWLPDGTVCVVDYKFGSHNRRAYYEQVRDYMTLLSRAGYTNVKGYLWFPLTATIITVDG